MQPTGLSNGYEIIKSDMTKVFRNRHRSRENGSRSGGSPIITAATLLLALTTTGFAVPLQTGSVAPLPTNSDAIVAPSYRLTAGDTVAIEVLNKPALTRTVTIPVDGKISYHYVGEIQIGGLTIGTFSDSLRKGLSKELTNPQVTVTVVKRHSARVGIMGSVRSSGKFELEDGWRLLDLIAESGGLTVARPEWVQSTLVRGSTGTAMPVDLVKLLSTGDIAENVLLEPGDLLLIQEKEAVKTKVQVLGAVAKPGLVGAPPDGSILTVITDAGGLIPRAKLSDVTIRRDGTTIPVDLTTINQDGSLKAGASKPLPTLQPGDTLTIPMNSLTYSVLGAVPTPGPREYIAEKGTTAVAALFAAGGAMPGTDLKNASIVRMSPEGNPIILPINLENAVKSSKDSKGGKEDVKDNVALQPGDVLFLPTRKQGRNAMDGVRDVLSILPFTGFFFR